LDVKVRTVADSAKDGTAKVGLRIEPRLAGRRSASRERILSVDAKRRGAVVKLPKAGLIAKEGSLHTLEIAMLEEINVGVRTATNGADVVVDAKSHKIRDITNRET